MFIKRTPFSIGIVSQSEINRIFFCMLLHKTQIDGLKVYTRFHLDWYPGGVYLNIPELQLVQIIEIWPTFASCICMCNGH